MLNVSCTLWSVISIPIFFCFSFATICCMSSTAIGSTPAKGSSRRINFGSVARARAISVRRLSPPESTFPKFFLTFPRPNSLIRDSNFSSCSFLESLVISRMAWMFSSTLNSLKTEASCGRYPIPCWARLNMGQELISVSSRKT